MTLAESILARASKRGKVTPGEYVTANIDKVMCHEAFALVGMALEKTGIREIWDPDNVHIILDHYMPASTPRAASIHKMVRAYAERFGIRNLYRENQGIAHQVMMENGNVLPGELILGTDSHTCTYGALSSASCGIGITEMAYVMATGKLWFQVPETIRFVLSGCMSFPLTSKDIILKIAGDYSSEIAQYKSVEFVGPATENMSISSRMTMSNMAVEIGAKFGFFHVDMKTLEYLKGRVAPSVEVPDLNDDECQTFYVDLNDLEPQVALPHSIDNVKPVSQVKGIEIHQAVLGSCTNGRLEDLQLAAELIKGKSIHPHVRLLVIPASKDVYRNAMEDGTLATLLDAGGVILNPGCGPCFGAQMGLLAPGERCISSTNRNFKGRMGSDQAEVYLASPATVIASAHRGCIADPRDV